MLNMVRQVKLDLRVAGQDLVCGGRYTKAALAEKQQTGCEAGCCEWCRTAWTQTFDHRVLESLRQVVTLLLVLRVAELVFGFLQLPLQPLQPPLLLLCLALRLLLQPLSHP